MKKTFKESPQTIYTEIVNNDSIFNEQVKRFQKRDDEFSTLGKVSKLVNSHFLFTIIISQKPYKFLGILAKT